MRVLTGHCVEMDSAPPYLPYVEMIEQAISSLRSHSRYGRHWATSPRRSPGSRPRCAASIRHRPAH